MCAAQLDVLRTIGVVAGAIGFDVHLVRDVEVRLPVLDRAGFGVRDVPLTQLRQCLHRR